MFSVHAEKNNNNEVFLQKDLKVLQSLRDVKETKLREIERLKKEVELIDEKIEIKTLQLEVAGVRHRKQHLKKTLAITNAEIDVVDKRKQKLLTQQSQLQEAFDPIVDDESLDNKVLQQKKSQPQRPLSKKRSRTAENQLDLLSHPLVFSRASNHLPVPAPLHAQTSLQALRIPLAGLDNANVDDIPSSKRRSKSIKRVNTL